MKKPSSVVLCFDSIIGICPFLPKNGMSVIVKGYISLYVRDGQYQCYVEEMKDDGLGELYIAFETMKRKLQEEGLFDPSLKKKLPFLPRKVGIVTSHTGAAIRDILQISIRRFPNMDLLIVPVRVQGEGAAAEIAWGIEFLNTRQDIDVIIVARGGGSVEELWAFNEECVARSIFQSKLPVVSAVGHETDFTIADFVADLRAPTPSAAAELVIPMKERREVYDFAITAAYDSFD
ncbi:MAG: exodeoxyribonuclease VII large subunit [Clostridia bacterium]